MKKIVLIAGLAFLFTLQHAIAQKKDLEFSFGGNASIFKGDEEKVISEGTFLRRFAGHWSVLFGFKLGEHSKLKMGLSYCSRGTALEVPSGSFPGFGSFTIEQVKSTYYEVPVLYLLGSESIKFHIGPQWSFLRKSDVMSSRDNDFGIKYGIGIEGKRGLIVRMNFYKGFLGVFESDELKTKNNYYQLALGYKFWL